MKKIIYISCALIIFLLASTQESFACSCVATPDPEKKQIENAFNGSDAIFSGEVIEIKESQTEKISLMVKFKIAKSWKGESSQEITITTTKDSAMCGYNFEVGKTYLVYAFGKGKILSTTNCSRTALFSKKGDVKHLDKLKRKNK